jgi:hypothetical protein
MSVADLFVAGAPGYSETDTKLFDDVIGHLIEQAESAALVDLSAWLAAIPNAPMGTNPLVGAPRRHRGFRSCPEAVNPPK